jgi:predicted enzyme related to lactoylglutathione lyase
MTDQTTPQEGEFCWHELMTNDTTKAKKFYSTLLGWECEATEAGGVAYTLFKSKDKNIGGMMAIPQHEAHIPPHWMNYISVKDVKETLKKAEALGAKVIVPVTPVSDFGLFIVIQDPTGAAIAFWQSLKSCG